MIIKRISDFFLDIIEVIVFSVSIFLFIYLLIMQPHKIRGASMEPNFPNGEYLLTDKISYRFNNPQRGDVVVFEAPVQPGEEYIKRIIALPGENVSIKDNNIFINEMKLDESYISDELKTSAGMFLKNGTEITVPENNYFVLGDNRPFSSDSRSWGTVSKDKIKGKAWLIYWPVSNMGIIEGIEY